MVILSQILTLNYSFLESKRPKNGLWQIKKAQEPGLIAIQSRDSNIGYSDQSTFNVEMQSNVQQRNPPKGSNTHPNNMSGTARKGPRRGGGRGEMKIYAPKQPNPTIAAKNGP